MNPEDALRKYILCVNVTDLGNAHQCHKAHSSANIPHLDSFVSGAREEEGAWFTALLALKISVKNNETKPTKLD